MLLPKTKYKLGDIVFGKVYTERVSWIVTTIHFCLDGGFYYTCSSESCNRDFFEKELIDEYEPSFED